MALREALYHRGQTAGVPSTPAVAPSVSAAQSTYASISHLWFLTTEPVHQSRPEPAPETLGPGQNNAIERTTGPVSPRRTIVGEILIGSLDSGPRYTSSSVDPCSPGPQSLWLLADVVSRFPEEYRCD